jgi:hypothetical protein
VVEAAEACDGWEWLAVELIWGLGGYSDVVSQQVIRGPIAARFSRSDKVGHGLSVVDTILVEIEPFKRFVSRS